ncbi:unnamed protein product [Chironomus riparius]|uniref:Uncharacterized protein n=1 Tax=Chironomus riparius TaxID=315576 RepID=A0A9N9S823_9DIPT|nr:unnamed protein product [Chironomus riparius]
MLNKKNFIVENCQQFPDLNNVLNSSHPSFTLSSSKMIFEYTILSLVNLKAMAQILQCSYSAALTFQYSCDLYLFILTNYINTNDINGSHVNVLSDISDTDFKHCENLEFLDLTNTKIFSLPENWLLSNPKLSIFTIASVLNGNIPEKLFTSQAANLEFLTIVFNRKKLREYILQAAGEDFTENDIEDIQEPLKGIYKEIANETKGKLVSIMFDSASRHGRHVFAVSLRYAKGDKVVERTIGVITQHQRQTGANLFNQVELLIRKVGLTINDIYSTCTDQGANMLRAADLAIQAQDAIRICRAIANLEHEEEINIDGAQAAERAEEMWNICFV